MRTYIDHGAVRYPEDHPKHAGQIMAVTRLVRA